MSLPYVRSAWDKGLVQSFLSDEYIELVSNAIW